MNNISQHFDTIKNRMARYKNDTMNSIAKPKNPVKSGNQDLHFDVPAGEKFFFDAVPKIIFDLVPTAQHLALYLAIIDSAGVPGTLYVPVRSLARKAMISEHTVITLLKDFETLGLIKFIGKKKRSPNGKAINHYQVIDIWKENVLFCLKKLDYQPPEKTTISEIRKKQNS